MKKHLLLSFLPLLLAVVVSIPVQAGQVRNTQVYWGDTHLHTSYSPDAYLLQNRTADPDTAYRYAKGLPVVHPFHRAKIQIGTPLDFLVVADHGEFMGVIPKLLQGDPVVANTPTGKKYTKLFAEGKATEVFTDMIRQVNTLQPEPDLISEEIGKTIWGEIMDAAERHIIRANSRHFLAGNGAQHLMEPISIEWFS